MVLPIIKVEPFVHCSQRQLALHFPYNKRIKNHLLKLDMVRWTRTHGCFYIGERNEYLEKLRGHLQGVAILDENKIKSGFKGGSNAGNGSLPGETTQSIRRMKEWMEQKRYSASTISTYVHFVTTFFQRNPNLTWNEVTKEDIENYNFRYFIKPGKSYSAQNQWINAIKMYLNVHGLDEGDLQDIERPRKVHYLPDVLTPEEVKSLFRHTSNLKHRTLLMLIYSCGLRIGEALALRPSDISSEEGLIYIRGGKGKKDRRVPLSPRVLDELRQYYQSYRPDGYLFEGQRGGKYSSRSASQVLKRALKKSDIEKRVTLHTLRHSYATHLTNRGVNIQYLQEILGHNSPKTTMLYTHLSGKDIRSIRSPLDDMEI